VLHWFEWFYTSQTPVDIAYNQGFVMMPTEGRKFILNKIRTSFKCDGVLVYDDPRNFPVLQSSAERAIPVVVIASPEISRVISLYADAYRFGSSGFARITVQQSNDTTTCAVDSTEIRVLDHSVLELGQGSLSKQLVLPFAGIPWGLTYSFCDVGSANTCPYSSLDIVLTPELAIDLISGRIEWWNDSRIVDMQENNAQKALVPTFRVQIVNYISSARERTMFEHLAATKGLLLDLQNIGIYHARTYDEAARVVAAHQGAVTFGPINRNSDKTTSRVARFWRQNVITSGQVSDVRECSQPLQNPIMSKYDLLNSTDANCWPLTNSYFATMASEFSEDSCLTRSAQEAALFAAFLVKTINSTTVDDPLSLVGMASLGVDSSSSLASLTCFGRSITAATVDMQLIPVPLIWVIRAIAFIFYGLVVSIIVWIFVHRFEPVLRASSPVFMWQMCLGFLCEISAVFPLTMQEDMGVSGSDLNVACMAAPWLYVTGFTLVYGSLLAKTWRIYRIFNNPAMKRVHITATYLSRLEILFALPVFVIVILWTALDPFSWHRSVSSVDPSSGEVVSTKGECTSNNLTYFLVPILCIYGFFILTGLFLAWKNRDTPTEFSEGRYVSAAIMTDTELLIIGVPILIIANSNPVASFMVKVLFIFLSVGAMIVVFIYPKFAIVNGLWVIDSSSSHFLGQKQGERRSNRNKHSKEKMAASYVEDTALSQAQRPETPTASALHRSIFMSEQED
jgi:hypothetical protein